MEVFKTFRRLWDYLEEYDLPMNRRLQAWIEVNWGYFGIFSLNFRHFFQCIQIKLLSENKHNLCFVKITISESKRVTGKKYGFPRFESRFKFKLSSLEYDTFSMSNVCHYVLVKLRIFRICVYMDFFSSFLFSENPPQLCKSFFETLCISTYVLKNISEHVSYNTRRHSSG